METNDDVKKTLLEESHVIAIVGLSPDQEKASNIVASYLILHGYRVIPVNPGYPEILGRKSYPSISAIPEKIDIVDIFMRAEKALPYVQEAIPVNPKAIWLQLGIKSEEARELVESHAKNILFIMDQCIKQEHTRLILKK
ncbi:MAG: CoA-binding protein [Syntrophorhabdaceae bacterium]